MVFGKAYWERVFARKEDPWGYRIGGYERKKHERQIEAIKRHCANPRNVLEIGCAEGVHTVMMAKEFPKARIVGVDISQVAIERAKKNCDGCGNIRFIEGDVLKLLKQAGLRDDRFDVIVQSGSLPFLVPRLTMENNLVRYFRHMMGLLTNSGIFVTSDEIDIATRLATEICYLILKRHSNLVHDSRYRDWNPFRNKYCAYDVKVFAAVK